MEENPYEPSTIPAKPLAGENPNALSIHPLRVVSSLVCLAGIGVMTAGVILNGKSVNNVWLIGFAMTVIPGAVNIVLYIVRRLTTN